MPWFERAGLKLHYFDAGSGPPVLLLHGWGGRARRQWHHTISGLQGSYHFYALELRGHGHSQEQDEPDYDWAELVADCEALRELTRNERWMVVGYSFGAIVGLHYAARHPDRVTTVCAIAPMVLRKWAADLSRWFRWPMAWVLKVARSLPPALSTKVVHNIAKTRLRTLFHTIDLMDGWKPKLTHIPASVPVIILLGENDRVARGEQAIAAAPKAEVRILPGAGHFPLWKDRHILIPTLKEVLDTYAQPRTPEPV